MSTNREEKENLKKKKDNLKKNKILNSKNSIVKKSNILNIGSIISFILILILLPSYIKLNDESKLLKNEVNILIENRTSLNKDIEDMKKIRDELSNEKIEQEKAIQSYEKDLEYYEQEIQSLVNEKESIQNEINILQDSVIELNNEKANIEKDVKNITIKLNSLSARLDDEELSRKYYFVQKDGEVDDKYMSMIYRELNYLPDSILNLLKSHNVKIYITTKNLATEFFNGEYTSVRGVAVYESDAIYIEDREKACRGATLHECGHLYSGYKNDVDMSSEFIRLYNEEKDSFALLASQHCISSSTEYFAEVFEKYFKCYDELKRLCPMTTQFMEELLF